MDAVPPGLVVFDLDGTLLRGDTVCEAIARHIGKLERMRELEAAPWSAVVPAREEMAAWYADHPRSRLVEGLQRLTFAPGAKEGIDLLLSHGIEVAICSLTWHFAVERIAADLGIRHSVGTALDGAGRITHLLPEDKPVWSTALAARLGVPSDRTAGVGDSSGDVPLLRAVRHPYFVGTDLPGGLPRHAIHMPDGNLLALARHFLSGVYDSR